MKKPAFLVMILSIQACTTATMTQLIPKEPIADNCPVVVYPDKEAAKKDGEIDEETCLVDGRGPTLAAAIQRARKEVCSCGTNYSYIKSTDVESFINAGSVTLVGITYIDGK